MPVSFSVNFVFHWDFAVSWDLQIPLITVTKDGLLINSTAVLSVKKKSISEEADCFPLSSPTWQSFSNGDRVVFQWEGKRLEEHHHCWNHSAGLGHPSLKEKTGALFFFIVVGQCSSGTGWWVAQPCPQIKIKPEFILHQSRCSQILKLSRKQNSKASLALPFSAPEMFKSISCTSLSAGA